MTTLKIIPDFENKTAECIGYPSAGEHVDVRIVGAANLLPSSTLRFRVKFGHVTLALFPRQGVNEVWEKEGDDLKCHLNLNTVQARSVCRIGNTVCHAILDQLGDDEHTVEPTLFFDDLFDVTSWCREPGADEPYDLDLYPNQIADLNQRVNAIVAKVAEAKNAAETAAGSANAAYESAQSAVEAAQTANARANSAESAARAAAVSAGRAEGALERIGSQVEEARKAATQAMASASSASDSAAAAEEKAYAAAESAESAASSASEAVSTVQEHAERDDNPHGVTKAQIGLGSVDNTSDMNKPVSHAQRRALELKQDCLSAAQIVAINSGIDQQKVAQIALNLSAISAEIARATSAEAVLRGAIAAIGVMDVVLADELPAAGEQYQRKLYLIPSTNHETRNVKDEFICVKVDDVWGWEQVGSTAVTIEFDEEPTEGSKNAARSGGIWSWVKSLLPQWLTSDYAEPATVASVANKRDKTDLDIKLPSIESCTWGTPDTELRDALIGVVPVFSNGKWSAVTGQWTSNLVPGTGYEESISFLFSGLRDDVPANATLVRGEPETVDNIAKKSELTAGLAAKQDKITASGILKGDGQGGVTTAEKSSTSADPANADYRDPADNTCHKTEFTEWSFSGEDYDPTATYEMFFKEIGSASHWELFENGEHLADSQIGATGSDTTVGGFEDYHYENPVNITATRSVVCTEDKRFVTEDVAAKQADIFDNNGKPTDQFAADLLGKQVANAKVRYALSTTASADMADRTVNLYEMNGNGTITFPTATTHEGVTYARDFLLRVKVTTAGSLTLPTDVTPLGDSFDFTKANDWLITFTEIGKDANNKAEFYIRAISLEG